MKTTSVFAIAALGAVLVGGSAVARADSGGFVSLGIGGTVNVGGDLENGNTQFDGAGIAGSLVVGQRLHRLFGVEVGLSRYGLETETIAFTNTGLAAAGRFTVPFTPRIAGYLRAGIEKTWMTPDGSRGADHDGTGWLAGLGAEYKVKVGKVGGSVWADLTRHSSRLVSDTVERDGAIDIFAVGVTVGF
jgi:hypothetical protein